MDQLHDLVTRAGGAYANVVIKPRQQDGKVGGVEAAVRFGT